MAITTETIKLHERPCDKCCGSGVVFDGGIHELIRHWRTSLGFPAKTLSALARIPYTSYCKFEKGRIVFGEARLRILVAILAAWSTHEQERRKLPSTEIVGAVADMCETEKAK